MSTFQTSDDFLTEAILIVDVNGTGTHTTIAAAIAAASAGTTIFIKPGTYTENLTLQPGVNLTAWATDSLVGIVIIQGKATFTQAGRIAIAGIQLLTNGDYCLAVTGSAASTVILQDCFFNCGNTGILFSTSSSSAQISISNSTADLTTTGIGLYSGSSPGVISLFSSNFTNSGNSTTGSTISAASCFVQYCSGNIPFSTTGTAVINISNCNFNTGVAGNSPIITTAGSGTSTAFNSSFNSGTASSVSVGAGTTLDMSGCILESSNTNVITGAGTCNYTGCVLPGVSYGVNVATQTYAGSIQGLQNTSATNTPAAGFLGEYLTNTGNNISALGSGTVTPVATISCTPGVWDINGIAVMNLNSATVANFGVGVNNSNVSMGIEGDQWLYGFIGVASVSDGGGAIPPRRYTFTTTTSVYLNCFASYSVSTPVFTGRISATRVG